MIGLEGMTVAGLDGATLWCDGGSAMMNLRWGVVGTGNTVDLGWGITNGVGRE